jgi:hypothetical protein
MKKLNSKRVLCLACIRTVTREAITYTIGIITSSSVGALRHILVGTGSSRDELVDLELRMPVETEYLIRYGTTS